MKRQSIRRLMQLLSFMCFPITLFYFSPYLIIEAGSHGIVAGCFIVFSILFVSGLVVGRLFCGWLCPSGGVQELISAILPRKFQRQALKNLKFIIWIPWILGIFLAFYKAGGIKVFDFTYATQKGLSSASIGGLMMYYIILLLITLLAITLGKRGMCHTICWMAPFMILGRKISQGLHIPHLQLSAQDSQCIQCHQCNSVCPMSLDVESLQITGVIDHTDCILCLSCVDKCPKKVIQLSLM